MGDVLGKDEIQNISDTLEARIDKRIANAEGDIGGIKENIPILKKELETYTDEMVDEAYKGIENLEEAIKDKEDVSNKVNTMNFSAPSNTKYPTEYAVWEKLLSWDNSIKQYISGFLKQDYYNKEFINESFEKLENKKLGGNYPITHPNCTIAKDEYYPSLKYLAECFEYFRGEIGGSGGSVDLSNYYTVVVNLSIGDYETIADKSPSEVYQLYKEGKNVVLSFKYSEYNEASSSWIEREDIYKLIGFIGGNRIIFASQDLHDSLQFTYVTAYMDDDTWDMTKRDDNVEIIDNLESTHTNAALSANQGRVLNKKIGDIETALDGLHAYAQGIVSGGDA